MELWRFPWLVLFFSLTVFSNWVGGWTLYHLIIFAFQVYILRLISLCIFRIHSCEEEHKRFDLPRWLAANDCVEEINPKLQHRISNLVFIIARFLRAYNARFTWDKLCSWVVLSELWPFSVTQIMTQASKKTQQSDLSISSVFQE